MASSSASARSSATDARGESRLARCAPAPSPSTISSAHAAGTLARAIACTAAMPPAASASGAKMLFEKPLSAFTSGTSGCDQWTTSGSRCGAPPCAWAAKPTVGDFAPAAPVSARTACHAAGDTPAASARASRAAAPCVCQLKRSGPRATSVPATRRTPRSRSASATSAAFSSTK
ncbi:MAG: hypothetical protein DCC71_23570 [Proteobacteria bacterium]|nr:MAG: hypothetical protein DCC71_23570 [Pseudomonadota bacterium]